MIIRSIEMNLSNSGWLALHTRPAAENFVKTSLLCKGYEVFCPEYPCRRSSPHRTEVVSRPLFPAYLFCRATVSVTEKIVSTPGVIRILGVGKTPCPVADHEIENIKTALDSGMAVHPWRYLPDDSIVCIMSGPLRGVVGTVVRCSSSQRVVVSVSLLQRSVAVTLDDNTEITVLSASHVAASGAQDARARPFRKLI